MIIKKKSKVLGLRSLSLQMGAVLAIASSPSIASSNNTLSILNASDTGNPSYITGNLGAMTQSNEKQTLLNFVNAQPEYAANGNEDLILKRSWSDDVGNTGTSHARYYQTINGIRVHGTSLTIHSKPNVGAVSASDASSTVYAVTGSLAVSNVFANGLTPKFDSGKKALILAKQIGEVNGSPELTYVYLPETNETKLAWLVEVSWDNGLGDIGRDLVFYSVTSGEVLTKHPQMHQANNRKTYTLNGGSANSAPGTLVCTNDESCGNNDSAQRAHTGASWVYDYYNDKFGRDSLDNNGMTLISSVEMGEANAYWTGSQMIYGKSNGQDFTSDPDIIGHELTHGVTQHEGDMVYRGASGALNEAWSDIFGITAESYRLGITTSTWLLGDDMYAEQGKAYRYMSNPTQDNYSKDWYPDHIDFNSGNDNGGVHGNSGIANLSFVLLTDGGTHPRNMSSIEVPGLGMGKAEQIYYRALTTYMGENTNFAGARSATESAASDLYGDAEKCAVSSAWAAVGVGSDPGACDGTDPGPDPDPDPNGELTNGEATSVSGDKNSQTFYTLEVPEGATSLSFKTSGGSGDLDMYVRAGAKPTTDSYDCRPYENGNAETCNVSNIQTGTYHVMIVGYSAYSGATLTGSYEGGTDPGPDPDPDPVEGELTNGEATSVSGDKNSQTFYTLEVPEGATNLSFTTSGGSGDLDMYVKAGSKPTTDSYDCRPYENGNAETCNINNIQAGTYHVMIVGYSAYSGATLTGSFQGGTDPGPDPDPDPEVINETISDISVSQGNWQRYTQEMPAGYTDLTVTLSGGSGDADLYVTHGSEATKSDYDCRPYKDGNEEVCTFSSPAEGTWHIDLRGYSAASGMTITIKANP